MTTLTGSSCWIGGDELGHQHGEAAVADVGDDLPAGEGVLDADRVRQPGRHRGQVAGQVELAAAADRPVPRGPGRDRAAVAGQDRVVGGQLGRARPPRTAARSGRARRPPGRPSRRASRAISFWHFSRKRAVGALLEQRQQAGQALLGVADDRHLGRRSGRRPGPGRPRSGTIRTLPGSGRCLVYGKLVPTMNRVSISSIRSSDGLVPSRPIPPVVYGESSGTVALPDSVLTIGAPSVSATASSSSRACSAPAPARIAIFLPVVQQVRAAAAGPRRAGGRARQQIGAVARRAGRRHVLPRVGVGVGAPGCRWGR